ncbi:ankyrin repeat domain-containing protein 45-like isoform X1 [Orbicella faveolata]|uniref:ankyrin repeat domain-containing protein 45-like isoform X1 n=1 Tax=Orbicella faveolata TaxID=48498 RepID=UPI0009E4C775|nr:ankyrin repeat domain-containing protein 45-like isoform X1 [Orbicella faveolata]
MVKELFEVATKGDIERLRELFEDPESIFSTDPAQALNKRDKDGKSALDIAAMLGRKEIVRELLERGAQINSQTKKGYTALHRAASWGHPDCLRVLVTNGADLQIRNAHGERAREAAARYKKDTCVDYLDRAEAQQALLSVITATKETISDPEKHMGRFTREDKLSGNRFCDEKNDWLESHKENATVEDIYKQKEELEELLKPILSKLDESGLNVPKTTNSRRVSHLPSTST